MGPEALAVLVAVSAAATVAAGVMQAQALSEQAAAADAAAKFNAEVARNQAKASVDAAAVNEQSAQFKAKLMLGSEKAAAGASGVDPLEGSPLSLRDETAQQTTLDALKIRYGGATQSTAYTNQAELDLFQGAARKRALGLEATGALIRGFGGAAGIYAGGARYGGGLGAAPEGAV